jgi:hypothetical protein
MAVVLEKDGLGLTTMVVVFGAETTLDKVMLDLSGVVKKIRESLASSATAELATTTVFEAALVVPPV